MLTNNAAINKIDVNGDNNYNNSCNINNNNVFIYSQIKFFTYLKMGKTNIQTKTNVKKGIYSETPLP